MKDLLLALAIGYVAMVVLVWAMQERLIFHPMPVAARPSAPPGWRLEEVTLAARDGIRLAGVLLLPPLEHAPLVVYYGGNAEEATVAAAMAEETYGRRAVLLVNYRGYGGSGGKPSEAALVGDAVEILRWASAHPGIDPQRVAVHGRSLGSSIAVQAAMAHPVRCVVLTSPFASARDIAAEVYPWLPVSWLIRHPFDSGAVAPRLKVPALFVVGESDDIIPIAHSDRLAALWGAQVERVALAGFGHNDLQVSPRYAQAIRAFLDRCL